MRMMELSRLSWITNKGEDIILQVRYSIQGAIIFEQSLWHPAPVLNPQKCGSTRVLYILCIPTIVIIMLYSKVSLSSIEILYVQEGLAFQMEMRLDWEWQLWYSVSLWNSFLISHYLANNSSACIIRHVRNNVNTWHLLFKCSTVLSWNDVVLYYNYYIYVSCLHEQPLFHPARIQMAL